MIWSVRVCDLVGEGYVFSRLDSEFFVDLVLHRQAVAVPSEAASDVVPRGALVASHRVLDGARQDVPVVRET